MSINPSYQGEVQLAGWTESHTCGAKVTFWLPDADSLDVFRGMTAKRGNRSGHRFMCVLVEIDDDETPVQAEPVAEKVEPEKLKGGPLAMLAGRWCADPLFQHWIGANSAEAAAEEVRYQCGVRSRSELDHNGVARSNFEHRIRKPFMQYCRDAGVEL